MSAATAPARSASAAPFVRSAAPRALPPWTWVASLAVIAVAAFLVRYGLLARGGGLMSSDGYDDGVYYAAADAFVHGRVPYRDFLLLHPPGIVLALAPFAWLGGLTADPVGMVLARLVFMGIGALNAVLVAVLARRFGMAAGAVAGVTYAVFYPAVYAERSALLEPLGTLGVLLALVLARRAAASGRLGLLLAGFAAGAAACVKIWYVVPLLILVAFQRGGRLRLLAGAGIAGALLLLPFLAAAPVPMVREVILDQLGRPRSAQPTLIGRIASIVGAPTQPFHGVLTPLTPHRIGAVLFLVAIGLAVLALTVRGAAIHPVLAGVGVVVLLASPSYFEHYAAFVAPPLAVTVGIGAARLIALLPPRPLLRAAAVGAVVLALVAGNARNDLRTVGDAIPAATLQHAAAQVRGCITSDDPVVLAAMNVLSRDLAAGCPVWPDVTGYTYDGEALRVAGRVVPRAQNPRWQHDVVGYLSSGSAVLLNRSSTGLDDASRAALTRGTALARSGHWVLRAVRH